MAPATTQSEGDSYIDITYLAVRLGTVIITFLLLFAVGLQIWSTRCVMGSLSVYYYTAVGPIFIGSLCAIGASLIMNRGSTDPENVALDFSGFLAFVVAFVPTPIETSCDTVAGELSESAYGIRLGALFTAGAIAVVAGFLLWKREARLNSLPINRMSTATRRSLWISTGALAGLAAFFIWGGDLAKNNGHGWSAIVLFIGIFAVVVMNARDYGREHQQTGFWKVSKNRYGVIGWLMVISGVIGGALILIEMDQGIFILEVSQIILFGVFWAIQTGDLGARSKRRETAAP